MDKPAVVGYLQKLVYLELEQKGFIPKHRITAIYRDRKKAQHLVTLWLNFGYIREDFDNIYLVKNDG